MKSLKILFMTALIMGFAVSSHAADKIGYVDLSRLFDNYNKTKDYDAKLEAKHNEFETKRNEKIEKVKEDEGKLALLKEDQKAALQKEIEDLKADLMEYDRQEKTNLTKERNEKIREILLEIEKIVSDYAEKEGYSFILNDRVLIYGTKTMDLTDIILKILNGQK